MQSLIDDIINSINNLIYQAISSLEDGLLNTPPEKLGFKHDADASIPDTDEDGNIQYPEARLEIENGLQQLETLLEATVDKAFDKFEIYVLRNILTVPEELVGSVKLAHYEVNIFFPNVEVLVFGMEIKVLTWRALGSIVSYHVGCPDAGIHQETT